MSFLDTVKTGGTGTKQALAPGNYGSAKQAGLKVIMYGDWSKPDKNGVMRHSFLVAATQPSNEAKKAKTTANGNGFPDADEGEFEGTAFMTLPLSEDWMNAEVAALAFTENSRRKNEDGSFSEPQADYVEVAIAAGEIKVEDALAARAHYVQVATDKVIRANTPEDKIEAAVVKQYHNDMIQVSKSLGMLINLLSWAGVSLDKLYSYDVKQLEGVEFSGTVTEEVFNGKTTSEVSGVKKRKLVEEKK